MIQALSALKEVVFDVTRLPKGWGHGIVKTRGTGKGKKA